MTVFTMLCMRHAVRLFGIVDHDVGDGDGDDADDSGACCVVAAGVISVIGSTVTTIATPAQCLTAQSVAYDGVHDVVYAACSKIVRDCGS